jgi:hypothetical protein
VPPEEVVTFAMAAGLDVERAARASFAPSAERGWKEIRAAVETEIRRRHGHEPEFALVRAELGRFSRLRAAAAVEPWRFDLHRP